MDHGTPGSLEIGRSLRDRAKTAYAEGEPASVWYQLATKAITTHLPPNFANQSSRPHLREYAASVAMRARLMMRHKLAGKAPAWKEADEDILGSYHFALERLKEKGKAPDQYEINFIGGAALQEAIDPNGSRFRAARLVGRSAWLAACSESPRFARETNSSLTTAERFKAKGRAFGRTIVAAAGVAVGPGIVNVRPFARLASKLM